MSELPQSTNEGNNEQIRSLRSAASTGLRPVTIRQLLEATRAHSEAPFVIDGIEVREAVVTVAHVVRVRRYATVSFLDLEDGTKGGQIIARRWLNGEETDGLPTDHQPFYARVVAKIVRAAEGSNTLEVKGVQVVRDPHELLFHILHAAFTALSLQRGPPPDSARRNAGPRFQSGGQVEGAFSSPPTTPAVPRTIGPARKHVASPPGGQAPQPAASAATRTSPRPRTPPGPTKIVTRSPPVSPSPVRTSAGPAVAANPTPVAGPSRRASGLRRDPYADLTVLERAILLQILNAPSAEDGIDLPSIVRGVAHHDVTTGKISDALDGLTDKGFIVPIAGGARYGMKTDHYPTSA